MNDYYQSLKSIAADISQEFLSLGPVEFDAFVAGKTEDAVLQVGYELNSSAGGLGALQRLKRFLDKGVATGQKRFVVIRCNAKEKSRYFEEFMSAGFVWETT